MTTVAESSSHPSQTPPYPVDSSGAVGERVIHQESGYHYVAWTLRGRLHRQDGPAVIYDDGNYEWYCHGQVHRDNGPAVKHDGKHEWYQHDELHREDGPAVEIFNGPQAGLLQWMQQGKRHRDDGPAYVHPDGTQEWWCRGQQHREDGPAVIFGDGTEQYWINHQLHRTDGPAIIYPAGNNQYWLHGEPATEKEVCNYARREAFKAALPPTQQNDLATVLCHPR